MNALWFTITVSPAESIVDEHSTRWVVYMPVMTEAGA